MPFFLEIYIENIEKHNNLCYLFKNVLFCLSQTTADLKMVPFWKASCLELRTMHLLHN